RRSTAGSSGGASLPAGARTRGSSGSASSRPTRSPAPTAASLTRSAPRPPAGSASRPAPRPRPRVAAARPAGFDRQPGGHRPMPQTYSVPVPAGRTAEDLLAKAKEAGRGKGIVLVGDEKAGTFKGTAEGSYVVSKDAITIT